MKIVAINGSPRKEGNTAEILKKVTEEHEGIDLVYHNLVDMNIKDCLACMYCKSHDGCSIKDDMTGIYQDIRECDTLILASPIYMGAETALLKALLDRMYALLSHAPAPKRYEPRLEPGKKFVVIFTCGNADGDRVLSYMKDRYYASLGLQGMSRGKVFIISGVRPSTNIMEKADVPKIVEEIREFIRH